MSKKSSYMGCSYSVRSCSAFGVILVDDEDNDNGNDLESHF
jgi:hypothetical protein